MGQYGLKLWRVDIHHRDTEDSEGARRFEGYSTLCALCVSVVKTDFPFILLSLNHSQAAEIKDEARVTKTLTLVLSDLLLRVLRFARYTFIEFVALN